MRTAALALGGAALLGVSAGVAPSVALSAPTALVIGSTGLPDPVSDPVYIPRIERLYFPFTSCGEAPCDVVAVITPEELAPFVGAKSLDQSVAEGSESVTTAVERQLAADPTGNLVIAGGSQGAMLATLEKNRLAADPSAPPPGQVQFVLFGNEYRPNGGLLSRFPGLSIPQLGVTFGNPTRTDTGYQTLDVAMQYDGFADFPRDPFNAPAVANAVLGILYIHGSDTMEGSIAAKMGIPTTRTGPDGYSADEYQGLLADQSNRQTYGDTTYITIPTRDLPLLQPLRDLGASTGTTAFTALADSLEPTLRADIDLGYDRTIPYGEPTPAPTLAPVSSAGAVHDAVAVSPVGEQLLGAVDSAIAAYAPLIERAVDRADTALAGLVAGGAVPATS